MTDLLTPVPEMRLITEPGVYPDLSHVEYHADPVPGGSLSSTGVRKLLPPSCPAKFRYWATHPEEPTDAFDLGNAAHDAILEAGPEIVVVQAADWRTKKARETAEAARSRGAVPVLREQYEQVRAMREALFAHPFAGRLFEPGTGTPEASLVWRDGPTGVMRRARLDWLPQRRNGRMIIPDYKTAKSAYPPEFAKSAANYGYHQQGAFYRDGARALDLADDDAVFVFVVQEREPPYVVSVVQLDVVAMRIGDALNRRAIDLYAECVANDHWPPYTEDVAANTPLPYYYERQFEELLP